MVVLLSFSNFKISFILSADIPFKCKSFICDANFSKEPPAYKLARPPIARLMLAYRNRMEPFPPHLIAFQLM
jgi:hypothetical protein